MAELIRSPLRGLKQDHVDRWHQAVTLIARIRDSDSGWRQEMADVAQRYNADWVIPLVDVAGEPTFPSIAAQLLSDAIDSNAQRANDQNVTLDIPVMRNDGAARDRASLRRRSWYAHYHESQLNLRLARAFRQLFGYDTFCLKAGPDFSKGYACISTENPLHTYPEPMDSDEIRLPHYIGFIYGRTSAELRSAYPESMYPDVHRHIDQFATPDEQGDVWDIMYWVDDGMGLGEPMILMGLIGMRTRTDRYQPATTMTQASQTDSAFLLKASQNRAGIVPAVCPKGPTLDRPISEMTRVIPIVDLLNKAFALDFIASEKAVFPDRYVVGSPGRAPKLVGGQWYDGRTGRTNILEDVQQIGELQSQPGPLTQALIANLERNARMSSGNPAMMGGELTGSVRSGQTVNALAGVSIDPKLKEAQHVMEYGLSEINVAVAEIEKAYFGDSKIVMFSGWPGQKGRVEYSPKDIWDESTDSTVSYPMPGMDAPTANVALGQAMQARLISRKSAQQRHPLVLDAEMEEADITAEAWDDIIQQSVIQQIAQGQMALTDAVALRKKIKEGKDPIEALAEVQEEAQARQAAQAPPENPAAAMPGINDPQAGGQMQPPPGPPPPAGAQMEQMVQAMMAQGGGGGGGAPAPAPAGAPV